MHVNSPVYVVCKDTATTEIYTLSLHDALPFYVDMDGIPDPSIYDLDGDNLVFANAVSALGAEVWVSGSSVRYTAPIFNDVASGGDPPTDTITVDVTDDSGLGAEPVQAHHSVKIGRAHVGTPVTRLPRMPSSA